MEVKKIVKLYMLTHCDLRMVISLSYLVLDVFVTGNRLTPPPPLGWQKLGFLRHVLGQVSKLTDTDDTSLGQTTFGCIQAPENCP